MINISDPITEDRISEGGLSGEDSVNIVKDDGMKKKGIRGQPFDSWGRARVFCEKDCSANNGK